METWQGLLGAILWFLLRFGIPIALTALIVWWFKRMDSQWQRQTIERRASMGAESLTPIIRCWLLNDCPEEKCQNCVAYQEQSIPCWQHFRSENGTLKEECLGCRVFRDAPVPIIGD